jgi:hypothetical protein
VLARAYRDIAERHLQAARLTAQNHLYEIAVFHCYHAFESIACAALAARSQPANIPKTHRSKVEHFIRTFRAFPFARGASALAVTVLPLRNRAIYPETGPTPVSPSQIFSGPDVQRLISRVNGVVQAIIGVLGIQ